MVMQRNKSLERQRENERESDKETEVKEERETAKTTTILTANQIFGLGLVLMLGYDHSYGSDKD